MEMNKLVSVIIPVYQGELTIERCVTSITEGIYQNIEIIIIDDCSNDKTELVCEKLVREYSTVKYFKNDKNSGVSFSRNRGLEAATGEYIVFVDSDDWVERDFVSTLVSAHEDSDGCIPVCAYVNHDEQKNNRTDIFKLDETKNNQCYEYKDIMKELYDNRLFQIIWNKLFVTSVIKDSKIMFPLELNVGEDFKFLLDYLEVYEKKSFIILNKALYHYSRDNSDSLATKFIDIDIEIPLQNIKKMYQLIGYSDAEIMKKLEDERRIQIRLYSYAIMHNSKFNDKEKKDRILKVSNNDTGLYKELKKLILKEKIYSFIKG